MDGRDGLFEEEDCVVDEEVWEESQAQLGELCEYLFLLLFCHLGEQYRLILVAAVGVRVLLVFFTRGLAFVDSSEADFVCVEENSLGEESLDSLNQGWNLQVPRKLALEHVGFHLDELCEGKGTLHQLAHVLDYGVFDLKVLGTDEKAHGSYESAYLLTNYAFAAGEALSECFDGVFWACFGSVCFVVLGLLLGGTSLNSQVCLLNFLHHHAVEEGHSVVRGLGLEAEALRGNEEDTECFPTVFQELGRRVILNVGTALLDFFVFLVLLLELLEDLHDAYWIHIRSKAEHLVIFHSLTLYNIV